jgi:RNA polymerase sigma factor (sigma-70 family)
MSPTTHATLLRACEHRVLTRQQEIDLGRIIQRGRRDDATKAEMIAATRARNELASHNMRLLLSVAKRYARSLDELDELCAAGTLTLLNASEKWDPERGVKFSTYCTWSLYNLYARDWRKGQRVSGREMPADEGVLEQQPAPEDDHDEEMDRQFRRQLLQVRLGKLPRREREIITRRYGIECEPETLQAIGTSFGITKERTRQLETRAMLTLKKRAAESLALV